MATLQRLARTLAPAALDVAALPFPTQTPDSAVFERVSAEYADARAPTRPPPPSPAQTLAALVRRGDLPAADALRRELVAHRVHIPPDPVFLRAALHAIAARRTPARAAAFDAWLALAPARHERTLDFYPIRHRLFRAMDHLSLPLVHRFGLALAAKGYHAGSAPKQALATLARYAHPAHLRAYLRRLEDAFRAYHARINTPPPPDFLAGTYSLAIRTSVLAGHTDAGHALVSIAQSRGITVSDFTLGLLRQRSHTAAPPVHAGDLPARLRSLRTALRSPSPPAPSALHAFITDYQALGRTRALSLLRALAYRHSSKSTATWAFTEMLHHRARHQPIHALAVFHHHFHPVGVPRKSLLSLLRGPRGQLARKDRPTPWVVPPYPMREKLWPSPHHTALVWDAILALSSHPDKTRLYTLLLSLVRQSRQDPPLLPDERIQLQPPPNAFDAAHFSPFVASWARRNPAKAAAVLQDMVHLGIAPSLVQWSMVARAYAQHADPRVALGILDRLEHTTSSKHDVLGVHTNVLRGFVLARDLPHALDVERRLLDRLGYTPGDRPATDAAIALLRTLELHR